MPFLGGTRRTLLRRGTAAAVSSSKIKSIQQGSITLAAAAATGTYTCSPAVTSANAMLVWNGQTTDTSTGNYGRVATRIALASNVVTATREVSTTNAVTVNFTVVEFASGVNSIQYRTLTITAGGTTATDTTFGTAGANAFVAWLGTSNSTSADLFGDIHAGVTLTNSTTITANIGAALATNLTVSYAIIDLDTTLVSGVAAPGIKTSAAASTTDVDTIAAQSTGTILVYGGDTAAATGQADTSIAYTGVLTSVGTATVTFTRSGTGTTSRTHYYTAVTWAAAALNGPVQRNTIPLSAQTTKDSAALTTVDATKSFANWGGFLAASANANVIETSINLKSDGTVVTANVNSAGSPTVAFEVVQFA